MDMKNQYLEYMLYDSELDPVGFPNGVLFLNEKETTKLDTLSGKITNLLKDNQYEQVTPPVFEYYETFEKGSGADIARKSFSFKDREGKLLSLRYDMTTPIARMAAMKYQKNALPLKFCYCGDVFREQPLHKGKLRQIKQVGMEHIGNSGASADSEMIRLLVDSLAFISGKFTVVAGDIQPYKFLLDRLETNESRKEAIHAAFIKKDTVSLKEILNAVKGDAKSKELLLQLPSLYGSPESVMEKINAVGGETAKQTERLAEVLESLPPDIRKHMVVDLGLIKDFSYYTSLTVEGYINGVGYPVANGGRYDGLFRYFGKDYPAIGFAIDISYCL